MNRTSLFLTVGGLFIAIAAGCQAIAGLETRPADPQATGCALPSSGNGRVRLANMANVGAGLTDLTDPLNYSDFCIRPSGSTDWGRPLFRDGGNDTLCLGTSSRPGGLLYSTETVPFSTPVGKIDVKAIPSGKTCSVAGTSEADGIAVGDNVAGSPVVTLMRWGGGSTKEAMVGLPERPKSEATSANVSTIRLVNGASITKSIIFGASSAAFVPASLTVNFTNNAPITPGKAAAAQPAIGTAVQFAIDASGYVTFPGQDFNLGAAYSDSPTKAFAVFPAPPAQDGTLIAIGDPGDTKNQHPLRAVFCDDKLAASTATVDAGPDAGGGALTSGDESLLAKCTVTNLPIITLDLVNTSFYGPNAPFETTRRTVVPSAIAARTSDLMCLFEVDRAEDRDKIIGLAAGNADGGVAGQYPYSFQLTTTSATVPTATADQRPPPATPPCAGSVPLADVNSWLGCVDQNCSTNTNDTNGTGTLNGTSACLEGSCLGSLLKLRNEAVNCWDCTVFYISSVTLNEAQNCVSKALTPFAFDGQNPSMMLSHYPLSNTKSYILPATGFRRSVLKAQVALEDQTIDFFCVQLSSAYIDSSVPYTGFYGSETGPNGNGWEDEQDLQAKEAMAWIKSETAADKLPAIIGADLHSDTQIVFPDGGVSVSGTSPEVFKSWDATQGGAFTLAVPKNFVETCDYCAPPVNPYNATDNDNEIIHGFLIGFPDNATQAESYWGNDPTAVSVSSLPGEPAPASGTGPLFEYFAHNYQILRP